MRVQSRHIALLLFWFVFPAQAESQNELKNHPSPYLAMHGEDPVHWQLWSKDVFVRAQRENKLVYVSVGYFACHWCHVMQRESYRNPDIARILNARFIPVKVDRELQPALDARLIDFVERTQGYSGWPLNVFITPQGFPLLGIVYLPPSEFESVLLKLDTHWKEDSAALKSMAEDAARVPEPAEHNQGPELSPGVAKRYQAAFVRQALGMADELEGGFGQPSKFPSAPQLMTLLDIYQSDPDPRLGAFIRLTLDRMATQGLRDQIRGGFFRYVVDPGWQTPHFEKMLYDNALLAEVYMTAAVVFGDESYDQVALDTLEFMLREMASEQGPFVASLSAVDNQGVEGGFYLWDGETLQHVLSKDELRVVRTAWGTASPSPLPDGYLPVSKVRPAETAQALGLSKGKVLSLLESAKSKLRQEQKKRSLPRDHKLLAGWNGLALRALSIAARKSLSEREVFQSTARRIRDYVTEELWDGKRLLRARSAGQSFGDASLEDYAYVSSGLYAWAQNTGRDEDYATARAIVDQAWERFYSAAGWRLAEETLIALGASEAMIADGPMPSPSAVLVSVSLQLARHDKNENLRKRALSALNVGHQTLASEPFWHATQVRAISDAQRAAD
jgi:uncharacterized protein YyaL (SSP411 family)